MASFGTLPIRSGRGLIHKRARIGAASANAFSSVTTQTSDDDSELESRSCQNATDDRLISFAQRWTTNVTSKKKRRKAINSSTKAARSFSDYYRALYGSERWDGDGADGLCHALMEGPTCHAALINRLHNDIIPCKKSGMKPIPWVRSMNTNLDSVWIEEGMGRLPTPTLCPSTSLLIYYCLDPASLLPVIALNLPQYIASYNTPAKILDMCAAPGGKTLAILQSLFGGTAQTSNSANEDDVHHVIVANESSRKRRNRLENILADYVPLSIQRSSLVVTGVYGTMFASGSIDPQRGLHYSPESDISPRSEEEEGYTHVLCDVPCSGERYVLRSSSSLAQWNAGSSKHLQKKQLSLLNAAVKACRPGGQVVYSTCSINTNENDVVVEKLLSKRGNQVEAELDVLADVGIGESTKYGKMILPDHISCKGMGPMYVCALRKK